MEHKTSYRGTIAACYIGNFTQAVVINLTPLVFLLLREEFGLSYGQFGFLVMVNFCAQVAVDILFAKPVDRYGYRVFAVWGHIICVAGFFLFAATPSLFKGHEYIGFLLATLLYAGAGGLMEVLLSPIVDSIPSDTKDKAMALLHSVYAWGKVITIISTTLAIFAGVHWRIIVLAWSVLPIFNAVLFSRVPIPQKERTQHTLSTKKMLFTPAFFLAFGAILFGGASEVTMSQWTSSFMQKGLGLPKIVGDLTGMCGFAVMMGIGRLAYGLHGEKWNLTRLLLIGSAAATVCYLTVALSPWAWLSVAACILTGLCISLLWPGTLSLASARMPHAGTAMFALLAAGGDIGASIGPWLTGVFTDGAIARGISEQQSLHIGILCAVIFPLLAFAFQWLTHQKEPLD